MNTRRALTWVLVLQSVAGCGEQGEAAPAKPEPDVELGSTGQAKPEPAESAKSQPKEAADEELVDTVILQESHVDEAEPKKLPTSVLAIEYDAPRLDLEPVLPAPEGDADERLLFALRRQFFVASRTDKVRAQLAIADAEVTDPGIKEAQRVCVEAQWAIEVGHTLLEGLMSAKDGWTDNRTGRCMDAVMKELEARGAVERSAVGVDALAKESRRRTFGLEQCHREWDDMSIARPFPESPTPLKRPAGVAEGTRSDIIVHVDRKGNADLTAVVNADASAASDACFASLGDKWRPPKNEGRKTSYCRFVRCVF